MKRLIEQTACEHGEPRPHLITEEVFKAIVEARGQPLPPMEPCDGGSITILGEGFYMTDEGHGIHVDGENGDRYLVVLLDGP